jgi:hypothetical protein
MGLVTKEFSADSVSSTAVFTGTTAFQVLAFNPTDADYERLTKQKSPYPITNKNKETEVFVLNILLKEYNTGKFFLTSFDYHNAKVVSSTGKTVFINEDMQTAYLSDANADAIDKNGKEYFSKKGRVEAWTNEDLLLEVLSAVLSFTRGEDNLGEMFKKHGLKISDFRKGDFSKLNSFLSKKVNDVLTFGEVGFTGLIGLNTKKYMKVILKKGLIFKSSVTKINREEEAKAISKDANFKPLTDTTNGFNIVPSYYALNNMEKNAIASKTQAYYTPKWTEYKGDVAKTTVATSEFDDFSTPSDSSVQVAETPVVATKETDDLPF